MSHLARSTRRLAWTVLAAVSASSFPTTLTAQGPTRTQPNDVEYTAKIKEYLQDPRITTELFDHLPASATVPTPLKFL